MADEAWTLLNRIKTVAKAKKNLFREVRIEAGSAEDVSASKHPALVIRFTGIDETAYEGIDQYVHISLNLLVIDKDEETRVQQMIEISNDLKNALEGDATVKSYISEYPGLEPQDAEAPLEHWKMDCVGYIDTTRTGR